MRKPYNRGGLGPKRRGSRQAADPGVMRYLESGIWHLQAGDFDRAELDYKRLLHESCTKALALHHLGLIAFKRGRVAEAVERIRASLAIADDGKSWLNLAVILGQSGDLPAAKAAAVKACKILLHDAEAFTVLGNLCARSEDETAARSAYTRALECDPRRHEVRLRLGELLLKAGDATAARAACNDVLAEAPRNQAATLLKLRVLAAEEPTRCFDAVEADGEADPAVLARRFDDLGVFLISQGRIGEALKAHARAVEFEPDNSDWRFNLARAHEARGEFVRALEAYKEGLALDPDRAEAYNQVGVVLRRLGIYEGSLAALRHAITLKPGLADAHYNLGVTLKVLGRFDDSIAALRESISRSPQSVANRLELANVRRTICDWTGLEVDERTGLEMFRAGAATVSPFILLSMPDATEIDQLNASKRYAAGIESVGTAAATRCATAPGARIRIGYLSGDYCEHATALLISEVLEQHDRGRFEVHGYCFSPEDGSEMRRRVINAFDRFSIVRDESADETARRIRADNIDILIDLKGYTRDSRPEILACRPAPLQVNYLGYPGTMGAKFIDYIIADAVVVPPESEGAFSECIARLPHCYQPNDRKRPISAETFQRAELGLPEDAFVFCSFNNSYKFNASTFEIWMRLLAEVPGSVLWLLASRKECMENLRGEAERRGIDPRRIVFAERMANERHLARMAAADLFLDSVPCNAHTTASDALWAGLPVLTEHGHTFAGRVASSLLLAIGLQELVTRNPEDYEALALDLARNPAHLAAIRERLREQRLTAPLFDSVRYTKNLEKAFETMNEIRLAGAVPRTFCVVETPPPEKTASTVPGRLEAPRHNYECCPICWGQDIPYELEARIVQHPLYRPELPPTVKWRCCADCGHVFTEGYFTKHAAALIFSATNEGQKLGHDVEGQRKVSARIVERLARHVGGGEWLDIGIGNGSLLFTAAEWGYAVTGTDLREENVAKLRSLGYEAYCADVEELPFRNRFSVVSMADVLEHIPFPARALKAVSAMMKPGGALFVSMPNMDTIVWRALHASGKNPYWGEIEHYHNFDRKRLVAMLAAHGFRFAEYNISERFRSCMEIIAIKETSA